jgi:hypothetical protein
MYSLVALLYVFCVYLANTLLQTAPLDALHAVTGTPPDPAALTHTHTHRCTHMWS